jgi:hypothetical protein
MIRQALHMRLTEALTFMTNLPCPAIEPGQFNVLFRTPQHPKRARAGALGYRCESSIAFRNTRPGCCCTGTKYSETKNKYSAAKLAVNPNGSAEFAARHQAAR